MSVREAEKVYRIDDTWGATGLLEDADLVCEWCKVVRIDGEWKRMVSVEQRAYQLGQVGSKTRSEYEELLTRGIEPGATHRDDTSEPEAEVDGVEW
jgi:hypothetical protein